MCVQSSQDHFGQGKTIQNQQKSSCCAYPGKSENKFKKKTYGGGPPFNFPCKKCLSKYVRNLPRVIYYRVKPEKPEKLFPLGCTRNLGLGFTLLKNR